MRNVARIGDPSVCDNHHLAGAAAAGSANVRANSRGVVRVGDPGMYGGDCKPANVPWRALEASKTVRVNGRELVSFGAATSHPHSYGRMLRGSADVRVGGPTFILFERAREDALEMLDAAQGCIARWNPEDRRRFKEWFGDDSEETRQRVAAKFAVTRERLRTATILHSSDAAPNDYAYVKRKDSSRMYMDEKFWETNRAGPDRQGGVVLHEATHYEDGAGTRDQKFGDGKAYGRDTARELARVDPERAQNNADNYEYHAETTPRL